MASRRQHRPVYSQLHFINTLLEYDRVIADYSRFIETEVLPIIPQRPDIRADYSNLRFTTDPDGRAASGCSSGAAAAFIVGWFRPDLYRRILTFLGTFTKQNSTQAYPLGAWGYHSRLIAATPLKPLRVSLQVGENDLNLNQQSGDMYHDWVKANRDMHTVMAAKGYQERFLFSRGAGHCDSRVHDQELPKRLEWLWRGYPIP